MANLVFNKAKGKIMDATLDMDTADVRLMLIQSAAPSDPDVDSLTDLLAGAPDEATATNYVRKTTTRTVTINDTDNRGDVAISADITWTALGGASNNTIVACVAYVHVDGTNGNDYPVCSFDIADTPTNGSDFTLQWQTLGATARAFLVAS